MNDNSLRGRYLYLFVVVNSTQLRSMSPTLTTLVLVNFDYSDVCCIFVGCLLTNLQHQLSGVGSFVKVIN